MASVHPLGVSGMAVSDLAAMVEAWHNAHEQNQPPRVAFDKVAAALGVGSDCTGDPATARSSVTHTPKSGLTVSFYTFAPGHESDSGHVATAYYVATWRGAEYRGNVVVSTAGYHSAAPAGFVVYDATRWDALPDGCRKIAAALVEDAMHESGVTLAALVEERAAANLHARIHAATWQAVAALRDAANAERAAARAAHPSNVHK